jgi:hypothetical protein
MQIFVGNLSGNSRPACICETLGASQTPLF